MAEQHDFERWRDIREIHKQNVDLYKRIGGFFVAGLLVLFGVWIGRSYDEQDIQAFDLNLTTEFIGIVVTVGLFGLISQWQAGRRYKLQLVDEAASTSNETAKHAVHVMRRRGWLEGKDGLLQSADLAGADLREVNLVRANLSNTNLSSAKLQNALISNAVIESADMSHAKLDRARLDYANLKGVRLVSADLDEAWLIGANVQNSNLLVASLKRANLSYANLQNTLMSSALLHGAILAGANLNHADLLNAVFDDETVFDSETILPDGSNWTLVTEMRQFTDAKHPNFRRVYRYIR